MFKDKREAVLYWFAFCFGIGGGWMIPFYPRAGATLLIIAATLGVLVARNVRVAAAAARAASRGECVKSDRARWNCASPFA